MTEAKSLSMWDVGKIVGVAAISLGLNHLIYELRKPKKSLPINEEQDDHFIAHEEIPQLKKLRTMQSINYDPPKFVGQHWGTLNLVNLDESDALLYELKMMTQITCGFEKVNNLIVDLNLKHILTFPCPLVATELKKKKEQPFLMKEALVQPGEFVIQNCQFHIGQAVEVEKKFMRAGPRATQYFNPAQVKADIICLGKVTPGINNLIRQLVYLLKDLYKVQSVTGVKFSYKGYYEKNLINLTADLVKTIHHQGGCFLGVSKTEFFVDKIISSLLERGVNQVYLIGGNDTLVSAFEIYKEIKRRMLNIAICVNLKAINKDIAFFDTCFGFESAVEETQKFIEDGHSLAKSNYNSAVLIKVPGRFSGFLAMDAVRAARNANVCLVPEFSYDFYGEGGLLKYISDRIKMKGYCIIVYSQGASYGVRDVNMKLLKQLLIKKQATEEFSFDLFFKQQIKKDLFNRKIIPHNVFFFDSQQAVRSVPANSLDTKLCCQIALCSVQGLMCGYTNFAIGHIKNRVAMVPIRQMINSSQKFCLKPYQENWQRLLATTGQPSFINEQEAVQNIERTNLRS